jgi:ribosomal protein S14
MNTTPSSISLNALDRCDRCSAQAFSVYYKGDQELMFCRHHIREFNRALEDSGWQAQFDYVRLEELAESQDTVLA